MVARDTSGRTREIIAGRSPLGPLDSILERRRAGKNRLFGQKVAASAARPLIVAEGDSWFEYPYAEDLVAALGADYAILSLAKAADSFKQVAERNELIAALENPPQGKKRPFDIVMLSLGGNEVMGEIEKYVLPFQMERRLDQYIAPEFDTLLDSVKTEYDKIIAPIISGHDAHIILHGYDYPDPRYENGAQWIGPPLWVHRRIETVSTARYIAIAMLKRFNDTLAELAQRPEYGGRVRYVRLLGTVGSPDYRHRADEAMWADEIHPSDEGFPLLADKFKPVIDDIWRKMQQA